MKNTHKPIAVMDQIAIALRRGNRSSTLVGVLLGGFVPIASYMVAHTEVDPAHLWRLPSLLVLGGLVYSARTVYDWAHLAFGAAGKALGFAVLLEGVMVTMVSSAMHWVALAALTYLVVINGVATGCRLSLDRRRSLSTAGRR